MTATVADVMDVVAFWKLTFPLLVVDCVWVGLSTWLHRARSSHGCWWGRRRSGFR